MKHYFSIPTICLFFINLLAIGQGGEIRGNVFDRRENKGLELARIWLLETKIISATDKNGDFKICNISPGTYNLRVGFIGYGDTIISNIKITSDTIINFKIVLPPICQYDKSFKNNTCPICHKKDSVVKIIYGLPIGPINENKYFYAGCIITDCDPNWYCKRDKNKF